MNIKEAKSPIRSVLWSLIIALIFISVSIETVFAQDSSTPVPFLITPTVVIQIPTSIPTYPIEPTTTNVIISSTQTPPGEEPISKPTPETTPIIIPDKSETISSPTINPCNQIEWVLRVDAIQPKQLNSVKDMVSTVEAMGYSASIDPVGLYDYQLDITGKDTIKQLRDILNSEVVNKINFIGGAAEVNVDLPITDPQPITIELESNPSTGYEWDVSASDNESNSMDFERKYSNREGLGTQAIQTFIFTASKKGIARFTLTYKRPFVAEESVTRHLNIHLITTENTIDLTNPNPITQNQESEQENIAQANPINEVTAASTLPDSFDWRDSKIVSPIKDQGTCGSCWAFGTVGVMESALAKAGYPLVDLSEQYIVDCNDNNWGCNGGLTAHKYHTNTLGKKQTSVGAVLESTKPYLAKDGSCTGNYNKYATLTNWAYVNGIEWKVLPSIDQIKTAINTYGPIASRVCAGPAFQKYRGGLFLTDEKAAVCPNTGNHMVILVGWGTDPKYGTYWILRNSWGSSWGENGYMKIQAGISWVGEGASWVVKQNPGPDKITLISPVDGAKITSLNPVLNWNSTSNATSYHIQISNDPTFNTLVQEESKNISTTYTAKLEQDGIYYWRVRGVNAGTIFGSWSNTYSMTIISGTPPAPNLVSPANGAQLSTLNPVFTWESVAIDVKYQLQISKDLDFNPFIDRSGISATTFTTTLNNNKYYWRMRTVKADGNVGLWGVIYSFTIINYPPLAPELQSPLDGATIGAAEPTLKWSKPLYGSSYQLQISFNNPGFSSLVSNLTNITNTSYTPKLSANGTYYWRVRSSNINGLFGGWSSPLSFVIQIPPPGIPELSLPKNGAQLTTLKQSFSWGTVTNGSTYNIQFSKSSDFNTLVGDLNGINGSDCINIFTENGSYYWRVRSANIIGIYGDWSNTNNFIISIPLTSTPVLSSPSDNTIFKILTPMLSWAAVPNASSYHVQVSKKTDFSDIASEKNGILTNNLVANLSSDGIYFWRVQAANSVGAYSRWSIVNIFIVESTKPGAPLPLSPTNGTVLTSRTPQLSWDPGLFHAKYTIQISKKSNLSTFVLQRPSIDSTTYTPTLPDGLYYWHVRAVNSFGISEWSSAFSFSIDTLAPQAPILKAPKTGSVTIGLPVISWNTSKTAVEYRFAYSKTNYPTNPENISNWIKTTSFTPTAMDMMVPYYWFVQARDTAGNVSPWSAAWTVKVVPPVPAKILINAPLNKTITGIGETSIAWNPVSYGNIYEVQISQSALFKTIDFSYKTDKGVTSITTGSLKPGGWNIRIRAINLNNVAGPWSNVNSFTINQ